MNIIFLDIDGVLNSRKTLSRGVHLHPDLALRVRSLCELFDAKIVISSTWRIGDDRRWYTTLECLRVVGLPEHLFIDRTPIFNDKCRGEEIKDWLDRHIGEVDNYIIIDDDTDMLEEQKCRFINTKFEDGFTEEDFEKACKLFLEVKSKS